MINNNKYLHAVVYFMYKEINMLLRQLSQLLPVYLNFIRINSYIDQLV